LRKFALYRRFVDHMLRHACGYKLANDGVATDLLPAPRALATSAEIDEYNYCKFSRHWTS
jgi:hypothetical protein